MIVFGIDYGLRGAVAVLDGKPSKPRRSLLGKPVRTLVEVYDLYRDGTLLISPLFAQRPEHAFVESFMLRYANEPQRRACIRWGELWERLGGRVERHEVKAADWKKALGLPAKQAYGARKDAALALARRLWPGFDFERADQAEAALIGEYGWRSLT